MELQSALCILNNATDLAKCRPAVTAAAALDDILTIADGLKLWLEANAPVQQVPSSPSCGVPELLPGGTPPIDTAQLAASALGARHASTSVGTATYSAGDAS